MNQVGFQVLLLTAMHPLCRTSPPLQALHYYTNVQMTKIETVGTLRLGLGAKSTVLSLVCSTIVPFFPTPSHTCQLCNCVIVGKVV